jgi:hypothetical protein
MLFRRRKATEEAQKALDEAKKNLKQVQERGSEVSRISNALREMRERNHFSEQMEEIIVRFGGSP